MSIAVGLLRNATMERRHRRLNGIDSFDLCLLCRKPMGKRIRYSVAVDHERFEFVTEAEAEARGEAVSLFDVGKDCAEIIARALAPE